MRKNLFSSYLKTYFTFSKGERNGILILLIILLVVIISIFLIPQNKPIKNSTDFSSLKNEVDSLFTNEAPIKIVKAGFSRRDTLRSQRTTPQIIELNSSDSAELTKLSGIGPVFAFRIVKYRKILGGFYNINQLKEVYGLKEETILKIKDHVTINPKLITGISMDTASFRTLIRHPYIGKDRTIQIINLRKRTLKLQEMDLLSAGIFDSIQWIKVKPYLIFRTTSN